MLHITILFYYQDKEIVRNCTKKDFLKLKLKQDISKVISIILAI